MPINVFGNSNSNSNDNGNKFDTSIFVQKPYLRSNYIESNIEEDIDLENQFTIRNLPDPISIREACSKNYVDDLFNNPSVLRNTAHIDLNDRNITNARFIQVNQLPQIDSDLTRKLYVDNVIDEPSLVRNNQDNDFNNNNLTNINSITLNTQAVDDNHVITKAYVDQFHNDNERNRKDLGLSFYTEEVDLVKNDQDNNFDDKKLTNVNSFTINQNPNSDNQVANKKYIDDELDKNTVLRFNETLKKYLKVSVGNDIYHLTKYDKINITYFTEIRNPNTGQSLLQKWILNCLNKNYNAKLNTFLKSTTNTSRAVVYVETSGNNHGANHVMVSWERTDIIHISYIKFYYNRFSTYDQNLGGMGRFRIQLLLEDNSWSTLYDINNSQYSNGSTVWHFFDLDITQGNYGVKFIYDQIPTPDADMCFSNIKLTHSVSL